MKKVFSFVAVSLALALSASLISCKAPSGGSGGTGGDSGFAGVNLTTRYIKLTGATITGGNKFAYGGVKRILL